MKAYRFILFILISMSVWIITPIPLYSSDNDPDRKALVDLLNELELKINEADKKMIAHPSFIKDLHTLVEKYQNKLREVFLSENFSDGDFTKKPKWEVISGQFEITTSKRLRNSVFSERPVEKTSTNDKPDLFGTILREVIKSTSDREKEAPASEVKEASIWTRVQIGPVFEIDISMLSESQWGSTEIVLLGEERHIPFYRLVYNASPSSERPIQIYRERDSRSYLIDEAIKYPSLDDGSLHKVQWSRDRQGNMKVLVDGKEILSTIEVYYNSNFSGLAIVNRGGTYEWGPINILEAQ